MGEVKRWRERETERETERCEETKWEVESQGASSFTSKPPIFFWFLFCLFPFSFIFILILCAGTATLSQCFSHCALQYSLPSPSTGSQDLGFFYYFSSLSPAILHAAFAAYCMHGELKKMGSIV